MRTNQFTVISVTDEAIDNTSMTTTQIMEYAKTRDINLLNGHYVPNKRPTKYYVRAVPHSMWESYVGTAGGNEELRFRLAFQAGVERVENLVGDDGVSVNWKPTKAIPGTSLVIMSDEECNERFDRSDVLEIGSVIHKHSFLGLRKECSWQLPLLLFGPLVDRNFRPAEQNQSTASMQTNSSHSDPKAGQETVATESLSG